MIVVVLLFCICVYGAYHIITHKNKKDYYSLFNQLYSQEKYRFDCLNSLSQSQLFSYCIYIPEREDYIRDLFMQFNQQNICFFKGLEPTDISHHIYSLLSNVNKQSSTLYNKKSKLCVHLSYLMCILHAIQYNHEYILIFEDDIYFTKPFEELYRIYMDFRKEDFDVCFIGYCHCKKCDKILNLHSRLTQLPRNQVVLCKHAMMYKTSYLKKIWLDLLPLHEHSDRLFIKLHHKYNANICIVNQPFIFQDRTRFKSRNHNYGKQSLY